MRLLRDILFERSPYDNLNLDECPPDLQGWGSEHPVLTRLVERVKPTRIVEIGSWKGASAIHIAKTIKRIGLTCELVCVDTWLGSPEHWLKEGQGWYESLRLKNGYPQLYYTFLSNVKRAGLEEIIIPFPSTSESAAYLFAKLGIYFDIVYVDAAHEYEPVTRDLETYWNVLREPGILIGDDYNPRWPGVVRAADDFAASHSVPLIIEGEKFVIPKGRWVPTL